MECPNCKKQVPFHASQCMACGAKIDPWAEYVVDAEDGLFVCVNHRKEQTRLRCGRCDKPVCTKCVIIGTAGPRCRECSKVNLKVSARGVAHDVGYRLKGLFKNTWSIYITILLFSLILGFVRQLACSRPEPQYYDRNEKYETPGK